MERAIEVVTELMWGGIEATERIGLQQRRVWSLELDDPQRVS